MLSIMIDLPAPVSPVRAENQLLKSISTDLTTAIFSICNEVNILSPENQSNLNAVFKLSVIDSAIESSFVTIIIVSSPATEPTISL